MRPHPLCTRTYLKEISDALRASEQPSPVRRYDWTSLKYSLGLAGLALGILGLLWLCSLPKPDMHDRELIDSSTHYRTLLWPAIGQQFYQLVPGAGKVLVTWKGEALGSLPTGPLTLGDEYFFRGNHWVWAIPTGKTIPQWVDP